MIKGGRVTVDGDPAHLGQKVDPRAVTVLVDGIRLPVSPESVYVLLNKERGIVSTVDDPQGRPTVVDVVGLESRIYPVGRLDMDSEGLLVLTNDGDLTEHLTHPRHGVTKTYTALVDGIPDAGDLQRLRDGVELDDGPARAIDVRLIDSHADQALVELVMGEGRNREVRRMLETIGHPVLRLVRTAIGSLRDRDLKPGEWRHLTVEEVRTLYASGARDE
jgi:23S rRNA pseudouridine2605 synthase